MQQELETGTNFHEGTTHFHVRFDSFVLWLWFLPMNTIFGFFFPTNDLVKLKSDHTDINISIWWGHWRDRSNWGFVSMDSWVLVILFFIFLSFSCPFVFHYKSSIRLLRIERWMNMKSFILACWFAKQTQIFSRVSHVTMVVWFAWCEVRILCCSLFS